MSDTDFTSWTPPADPAEANVVRPPQWAKGAESEKVVEDYFVKRTAHFGGKAYKWSSPAVSGVPDRIVFHPAMPGRILLVELKAPGKVPGPGQQQVFNEIVTRFRVPVFVIDSRAMVDKFWADACRIFNIAPPPGPAA